MGIWLNGSAEITFLIDFPVNIKDGQTKWSNLLKMLHRTNISATIICNNVAFIYPEVKIKRHTKRFTGYKVSNLKVSCKNIQDSSNAHFWSYCRTNTLNFPFLKKGSSLTQLSVFSTISTSCAGHCDQCTHKKNPLPLWTLAHWRTQLPHPHRAVWNSNIVDRFCWSVVIITWHLSASVAVKALGASLEWKEL